MDLLAQTICSCSALTKWLSLHWSIDTACHHRSTWTFFFFPPPFLEQFPHARLIPWTLKSFWGISVRCVFFRRWNFSPLILCFKKKKTFNFHSLLLLSKDDSTIILVRQTAVLKREQYSFLCLLNSGLLSISLFFKPLNITWQNIVN